ncbi:MAG: hypothetical protein JSW71_00550 [Gemmatimonadota bacterium]|nr:MAG: hypothetical protein JSW71_00550 [Gemmatimonadota bacterium]
MAIRAAEGTVGGYTVLTHVPQPLSRPFGSAEPVEHEPIEAISVPTTGVAPPGTGFLDGIQRYAVVGRFGLTPVVRGYVAAAVMGRHEQSLSVESQQSEEFIAVNVQRLSDCQARVLEETGLPLYDTGETEREHPILEVHMAAQLVEARREAVELSAARRYLKTRREGWLVLDGSIAPYVDEDDSPRVLGLVKSHETQFLAGSDLRTALTLAARHRTSVFARRIGEQKEVHSWYLRLWPWEGRDLLFGLVRLERSPSAEAGVEASEISSWMLSERSPLSAPDGRWDRLVYPVRQVESYLRAQIGDWL